MYTDGSFYSDWKSVFINPMVCILRSKIPVIINIIITRMVILRLDKREGDEESGASR